MDREELVNGSNLKSMHKTPKKRSHI